MRKSYKELKVWQLAMDLAVAAYAVARKLPLEERFALAAQIRRAAVSIPANIAEGHGRFSGLECARHLSISSGSLRELEVLLTLAIRLYEVATQLTDPALQLADQVGRMLAGLIGEVHRQQGRTPRSPAA